MGMTARCSVLNEYLILCKSNICPENVTCVERPPAYKDHFPLVPRVVFIYKFDCIQKNTMTIEYTDFTEIVQPHKPIASLIMLFVPRSDDDHLVLQLGNGVVVGGCADGLSV